MSTETYTGTWALPEPAVKSKETSGGQDAATTSVVNLFWAGSILFLTNIAVLIGIWASPELKVNMYGEMPQEPAVAASGKPSPFTERVQVKAAKAVKQAPKLIPSAYVQASPSDPATAQFDIPRLTQVTSTPAALTTDSPIPLRRATQSSVVNSAPFETTPRRVSERAQVVVN